MDRALIPWTLAYLIGLALGFLFPLTRRVWWLYLAALLVSFLVGYRRRRKASPPERKLPVGVPFLAFLVILALAGHARLGLEPASAPPDRLERWAISNELDLEGIVRQPPERFPDKVWVYLEVEKVFFQEQSHPAKGRARIALYGPALRPPAYGDRVSIRGVRLRLPRGFHNFGGFDYGAYLARQGISALGSLRRPQQLVILATDQGNPVRAAVYRLRGKMLAFLDWAAEDPGRAFVKAMVLGERRAMPADAIETFNRSGIAHLLAISGAHVGMVALAAFFVLCPLVALVRFDLFPRLRWTFRPSRAAALLTVGPVLFYSLLVSGRYSVARATLMVVVYLFARALDRERELFHALALAALVILLAQPQAFLDAGFQLSFAAVGGVILALRRSAAASATDEEPPSPSARRWFVQLASISFWAFLFTAPLIAHHFQRVSVVAPLTNLVAIPLASLAIPLGLLACLVSLLSWELALIPLHAGLLLFTFLFESARLLAWPPQAALELLPPSILTMASFYLLMISLGLGLSPFRRFRRTSPWPVSSGRTTEARCPPPADRRLAAAGWWRRGVYAWLATASLVALVLSVSWRHWPGFGSDRGRLQVTFLDVDQGDAAVVRLPGGQTMTVDGGGLVFGRFDVGESVVTPFLRRERIGKIDWLVASHPDQDHLQGFTALLRNFPVDQLRHNGERSGAFFYRRIEQLVGEKQVPFLRAETGVFLKDRQGLEIRTFNVGRMLGKRWRKGGSNNRSLVLKVTYGQVSFLFAGDLEREGQRALLRSGANLRSTVLKLPHHGAAATDYREFWEAVRPKEAVISVGQYNRFGHPAPQVVRSLEAVGARIHRTDRDGCVRVVTDGKEWSVQTYRGDELRGRWALVPWF